MRLLGLLHGLLALGLADMYSIVGMVCGWMGLAEDFFSTDDAE